MLRSKDFSRRFIESRGLLTELFANRWDPARKAWKDTDPAKIPDIRDGVKLFQRSVFAVSEDKRTSLVTVTVNWRDPVAAADMANAIVKQLNDDLRERAIVASQRNIDYLRGESSAATIVALQQSVGRLLETELQQLMLAKGNEEFAFKVIDKATAPKDRFSPRRTLMTLLFGLVGGVVGVIFVLSRHYMRASKSTEVSAVGR